MKGFEKRLDSRVTSRIPVELRIGRATRALITEDIAARGVFVLSVDAAAVRELVRVRLTIPSTGVRVVVQGLVGHVL
jgi:hypothetical protein